MTLIAQPAHVPLAFVDVGGKRLPSYINPPWQKMLGPQLVGAISSLEDRVDTLEEQVVAIDARIDALETLIAGIEGAHAAVATLDFGASFTDKAQTVVTGQTWVQSGSVIAATVMCPVGVDTDELRLLDMRAAVSDLIPGVGFTITLYSQPEARGAYTVSCVGV